MAAPEPTLPPQGVAVTVSGSGQRFVHKKKKVLNAEESELYELAQAAGVGLDPELFRILLDLLKMNVAPLAVFQMLKSMCAGHRAAEATSTESHSTMVPANLPEARAIVFGPAKLSKIPAPLFLSSGLRSPRPTASKLVVYSPGEAAAPLSQGPPGSFRFSCCLFSPFAGRNKPHSSGSGALVPTERGSREGSSQRVPRQPSASRLQQKGVGVGKSS
ncbi:mitotic-spindle organizing protein 2B-like isoform X1 [Ambystoma mexicanum]|uniref:mitotic-spindle organizing protein 2B-like isoform X1 n=1 Tax=Ambystoma mexicanum TaxID=8296 RepID=UPI0037E76E74